MSKRQGVPPLADWFRLAAGLGELLARPVTPAAASAGIRRRLDERETNFLHLAERAIYATPSSPLRALLLWAGCELGDLVSRVRSRGLEATLTELRDQGVYVGLEELKGRAPLSRRGLTIETREGDFDNPLVPRGLTGRTSGTRSTGTRVNYSWPFIAEEAENECLLYEIHRVRDAPLALWYPLRPGVAGVHNLLMSLKSGCSPERWFVHAPPSLQDRVITRFLAWSARRAGLRSPTIAVAGLDRADRVAAWMAEAAGGAKRAVLRTFASSAIRAVQTAREAGIDVTGSTIFVGGEPLSAPRHRFLTEAGVQALPRYVTTESGLVGASCGRGASHDEMHLYLDRLAVVSADGDPPAPLLFTALLPTTPKLLLNTDLGDSARLARRPCACAFGLAGMDVQVSAVSPTAKLTGEGMSVLLTELDEVVGRMVAELGGSPDHFQFRRMQEEAGLERLIIVLHPELGAASAQAFRDAVLDRLSALGPRCQLAVELWRAAGYLDVVREAPRVTAGAKTPRLVDATPLRPR